MSSIDDARVLRAGPLLIDPARSRLRIGGARKTVEPRVMRLLSRLLESPGRTVSRDELLESVWGRRPVTDGDLSVAIHTLRRALGDEARDPRFVQTVPRRGYRWIGPPPRAANPTTSRRPPLDRQVVLAVALFWTLVGLGSGLFRVLASALEGNRPELAGSVADPGLAALIWIPITLGALLLARRFPLRRRAPAAPLLIHGAAALATSFVLNAGWSLAAAVGGHLAWSRLPMWTVVTGLEWLPINAGTYVVIVLLAHTAIPQGRAKATT